MEIREIGQTLYRRWWIPCATAAIVGILGIFQLLYFPIGYMLLPGDDYQVVMRMLVGVTPAPASQTENSDYDPRYFAWLVSEYLVDDFTQVVKSGLFAKRVSARLEDKNIVVAPDLIQGASQTGRWHRIITLLFTGDDKDELFFIAEAAHDELEENASFYFYQLGTDDSRILLLDEPIVRNKTKSLFEDGQGNLQSEPTLLAEWSSAFLAIISRMLTAFMVGTGLIFVIDYLEGSIYGRRPLDDMGMTVLTLIPGKPAPPATHLVVDTVVLYWEKFAKRYWRKKKPAAAPQLSEKYM